MADAPVETTAGRGGRGRGDDDPPPVPCFKLFGTSIVAETTTNGTKENEPTTEPGRSAPEQPTAPISATSAAKAAAAAATGLACPRCKSRETKFCYFNNYNVNQPRHFCRGCHRYWTAGGALRNVPVGAGRRRAARAPSHPEVGGGGAFGLSTGLDGVVVQQWLMNHDGLPAKRPNVGSFHERIR